MKEQKEDIMKTPFKILIILLLPFYLFAFHDHEKTKSHHKHSALEQFLDSTENYLAYIYDGLNHTARFIDETITGERSKHIYDENYIHVQSYYDVVQSAKNSTGVNVRIKIKLPNLKEKYKLILENDDNKVANEKYNDSTETVDYKDDKYNLGLQYDTLKKDVNLKFKAGIKLRANSYAFLRASANKKFTMTDSWYFKVFETLELNTKKNLENTTAMNFYKDINKKLEFVNHNEYYWNEKDRIDNTYNSLRINQQLNHKNSLNYVAGLSSNDSSSNFQTKHYDAYIAFKQYIRPWLYYDVIPKVFWNRDNNFDAKYAFRFNLGIIIGK